MSVDGRAKPSSTIPLAGPAPNFRAVSVTRSYEYLVQQIEAEIRSGRIDRGARLPTERELGITFGVSRGVVREAVKVLDAMGLVESRQGSGIYVRDDPVPTVTRALTLSVAADADEVGKLFEFRREQEAIAARFAAIRRTEAHLALLNQSNTDIIKALETLDWDVFSRADSNFHSTIADACSNPYLAAAMTAARDVQSEIVKFFSYRPGSMHIAAQHHKEIYDAIHNQDPVTSAAAMFKHIDYTSAVIQDEIKNFHLRISG